MAFCPWIETELLATARDTSPTVASLLKPADAIAADACRSALTLLEAAGARTEHHLVVALQALSVLPFLQPLDLLSGIVRDCVQTVAHHGAPSASGQPAAQLLVALMDLPDASCRTLVFSTLADLSQQQAGDIVAALGSIDILYYVCIHSLADELPPCRAAAAAVLQNLLAQATGLAPAWRALAPVLQGLLGHPDLSASVGSVFMSWITQTAQQPVAHGTEAWLMAARAMLHASKHARQWGAQAVHALSGVAVQPDVLLLDAHQVRALDRAASVGWQSHSPQDAENLVAVLQDASLGLHVRASAAEQVSFFFSFFFFFFFFLSGKRR